METREAREARIAAYLREHEELPKLAARADAEYHSRPWVSEMAIHTRFGTFLLGGYPAEFAA